MKRISVSAAIFSLILVALSIKSGDLSNDTTWNCSRADAIASFKTKTLLNPYPLFKNDPYQNQTSASLSDINATLANTSIVCAIQYAGNSNKLEYTIKNFADKETALKNGHIVTHQGRCGACSSLIDLSVYLSTNLTKPTRTCGMLGAISETQVFYTFLHSKAKGLRPFRLFPLFILHPKKF